jgi:5-(carboxyamino)imidazole ribonucleotide mutase
MSNNPKVAIIMGSDSDLEIMEEAARILDDLGISYEMTIASAHRTTDRLLEYAKNADTRGIEVIIVGAGSAAHAPGMAAAMTPLPVIGVPILGKSTGGLDSLLSIVQMPTGVPVATVAINNAKNAAILAAQILGVKDAGIREKVRNFKNGMKEQVEAKANSLEQLGYEKFLQLKKQH